MLKEYRQSLHTHTSYCDGKDDPEEMILEAIRQGFDTIGFSGHSPMYFAPSIGMSAEGMEQYKKEIDMLREKYRNQIRVLCGLEFEMYSDCRADGFDYVIGSCHYLKIRDEIVGIDRDARTVAGVINKYFQGNGIAYARAYYEELSHLHEYGNFDIVGHFDLLTKHCEKFQFFDMDSKEYRNAALECLHEVARHFRVFEVNTGAIARGYRTMPYPAPFILKEMKALNCSVVLTSDCHDKRFLNCGYKDSLAFIKDCGFEEVLVMTDDGWKGTKLT